jgi:hypothetical protein
VGGHPGLVETCREVFDQWLGRRAAPDRAEPRGRAGHRKELLDVKASCGHGQRGGAAPPTSACAAVRPAVAGGRGAVALGGLMEDAGDAVDLPVPSSGQWISPGPPPDYGVPDDRGGPWWPDAARGTRRAGRDRSPDEGLAGAIGQARTLADRAATASGPVRSSSRCPRTCAHDRRSPGAAAHQDLTRKRRRCDCAGRRGLAAVCRRCRSGESGGAGPSAEAARDAMLVCRQQRWEDMPMLPLNAGTCRPCRTTARAGYDRAAAYRDRALGVGGFHRPTERCTSTG